MDSRIGKLLRTNTALILLCIISIGVLYLVFHRAGSESAAIDSKAPTPHVVQSPVSDAPSAPQAAIPSDPQFADMPATTTFMSFIYQSPDEAITATGTCADAYGVVLLFPSSIDYRSNPAGWSYNIATACSMGQEFSQKIGLSAYHLVLGGRYYMVRASQGNKGTWHDPY